jgi:hypothetical protein
MGLYGRRFMVFSFVHLSLLYFTSRHDTPWYNFRIQTGSYRSGYTGQTEPGKWVFITLLQLIKIIKTETYIQAYLLLPCIFYV